MIAMAQHTDPPAVAGFGRVAWTRGSACLPLAELLSEGPAIPLSGDIERSCVVDRVDLLVLRRMSRIDLVPTVVPHGVDFEEVTAVTAAIGEGPHSSLAAAVTDRVAAALGVPAELATVYRTEDESHSAISRLDRFAREYPGLRRRAVAARDARGLIDALSPSTLLVIGAPGGSWLQRQIFGPGHRLMVAAPGGALVVRNAARRCYHEAADPARVVVSPYLSVSDALTFMDHETVPVADAGRLVGIVRTAALRNAGPDSVVADAMEPPVSVAATEPAGAAIDLMDFLDDGPVPVIDKTGHLVGVIHTRPEPTNTERSTP